MALALETVLPDFKFTALQEQAIKRIHEYKEELKRYGMYVRSSMELEFTAEDGSGNPKRIKVDLDKAKQYFEKEPELLPYIEKIVGENDLGPISEEQRTAKYEITAIDPAIPSAGGDSRDTHPEIIAGIMAHVKKDSLRQMLLSSSSLSGGAPVMPDIRPNFAASPYYDFAMGERGNSPKANISSSLHINVSLCDQHGDNLFAKSMPLFTHCTNEMVEVLRHAGLAMLPNSNSVARFSGYGTAPRTIGIQVGKKYDQIDPDVPAVVVRDDMLDIAANHVVHKREYYRIENKLPGADTDPFVGMAVTMAALVSAVRKHVRKTRKSDDTVRIKIDEPVQYIREREPIEMDHSKWVERFRVSEPMRELLGPNFYDAILRSYGEKSGAER